MATKNLIELYDKQYVGGEYQGPTWYRALRPYITDREERIVQLLPTKIDSILDIGCGEGLMLDRLTDRSNHLVGIDILESRLFKARKNTHSKIQYLNHDLDTPLPFEDATFQIVTCSSVLEYTLDPFFIFKEIFRVLMKNGILILEVPNIAYLIERMKLLFGILPGSAHAHGWQGGRLHQFTFQSLHVALTAENFSEIRNHASGFIYQIREFWPSLLSADIIIKAYK
ncbi:MAG: hypothetical protein UX04_C0001G0082 [Microgenomates group bacterium GW2011_GWF2_45_18]|nr:MAG: hypothetical protein UW18_C0003G0148 [Microgenomates group bacterium GW2011_GWF1_44_10]KKU02311.1 MAG: hypothetical protein UX04_C0001G0082 [Microgenomates group bacterium GW2011_GWF2_45_18]OGJ41647.1 MAG: hypothetical protein A2378_02055 [Candidatus Pacebacteria bacterium RIFOXYB1_FULL_44_10]HAU99223.1 hypothetical protein [Candidatus Paceibacterota bacterium]HAX01754.1 hypothetical protein [Candidatus Paceibacterota bacterium]